MNPQHASALAALNTARPAIARIDPARGPEDTAADIIEGWTAVEGALRALVGGTSLTGQSLIREARQRQLLSFDQANALAEFEAARARLDRTDYRPTEADVNAARTGFLRLESGLMAGETAHAAPAAAPAGAAPPIVEPITRPAPGLQPLPARSRPRWLMPAVGLLVLAAVAFGAWYFMGMRSGGDSMARGRDFYRSGQREAAAGEFTKAARENPNDAEPHIYLGRMAREVGNLQLASEELSKAINLEPTNGDALREMGSLNLLQGRDDLAARFYVRAVQADTTDRAAMGWLACAMHRQMRVADAQRFFTRAGPGPWTACGQTPPGPVTAPGGVPPGAMPPGALVNPAPPAS